MLLRVSGDANAEVRGCSTLKRIVEVLTVIHRDYLLQQIRCGVVAAGLRHESRLCLDGVTLTDQHIVYTQKVQINQCIFGLFPGEPSTDNMRDGVHFILILDRRAYAYRSRSLPRRALLPK